MSIQINVIDNNNTTRTILAEEGATFADVLNMEEIDELLGGDDAETLLVSIDATDVSSNARLRRTLLTAEVQDGATIEFDVEFPEDEEAEELGSTGASTTATVSGATGQATVLISGGIISVKLNYTPGITTLAEILSNEAVRVRSGYSAEQLAQATVIVNGASYDSATARAAKVLDGTEVFIQVNPRQASNKG